MGIKNLYALAAVVALAGCDWVDSTGRTSNSSPVTNISFADGQETETSILNELSSLTLSVTASDEDGAVDVFEWNENPVSQGKLSQCTALPEFNEEFAVDTLEQACTSGANCRVIISQLVTAGDEVDFQFSAPQLKANVGVEFELTAIDNEGGIGRQRSTICLVAINEAPDAREDSFTVLEGETLTVSPDDVNLLTNDSFDEHIGNAGSLQVLPEPRVQPSLASSLTLNSNGGFSYVSSSLPDPSAELAIDTFVYSVTDGVQQSDATVTVRVLAKNDPPVLLSTIPTQRIVAGIPFESDLSEFFNDEEGATLSFALADGSLPSSGGITLSSSGVLSGTAELLDEGTYTIRVVASDGSEIVSANITIVIGENAPVEAIAIAAQSVELGDTLTLDVSDRFEDPEDQPLTYSVDTSYADAELTMNATTGVFEAEFENAGRYTVDVSASDGLTPATSIRFVVNVSSSNVAPVFRGTILNQAIDLGDTLTPIAGTFSDANSDELEFSVLGTLPDGVGLNSAGVLSGLPTESGTFSGIRIIATDPLGEFARSNAFTIQVIPVVTRPVNTAPEFVEGSSVRNQGLLLGASITPLEPEFIDADGDTLSYSVIGNTLPAGVVINSRTGVISGTPTAVGWTLGLIVLATDPSGASATSDEFWIRVR